MDETKHTRERDPNLVRVPTIADVVALADIMTRDVTVVRREVDVRSVTELFVRQRIGCVPVVDDTGRPVGVITKSDVVQRLAAGAATAQTAADLMRPITIAINERTTIAHAAGLMAVEGVHHILIVDLDGLLVGIVTTFDIVRWLARNDGMTA